jgi:hypothetical protein
MPNGPEAMNVRCCLLLPAAAASLLPCACCQLSVHFGESESLPSCIDAHARRARMRQQGSACCVHALHDHFW